jgi:hypothetical protein
MQKNEKQTSFLCKKKDCNKRLLNYGEGVYKEGLVCGEFEKPFYYICKGCGSLYKWVDYGGWWPFSFEESQIAVNEIRSLPEDAIIYNKKKSKMPKTGL